MRATPDWMENWMENMKQVTTPHYDKVKEFMVGARQNPPDAPCIPDAKTRELRARLILEEALETVQALGFEACLRCGDGLESIGHENDIVFDEGPEPDLSQIVDGCCDIKVVTTGTLIACGVPDVMFQGMVDDNNLEKLRRGTIREDGKLVKPPDHKPPDIAGGLSKLGWPPDAPKQKPQPAPRKVDVRNCARCEGDHFGLEFQPFEHPVGDYTHFAPCPRNGQPLLMGTFEEGSPEPALRVQSGDGWQAARDIAQWLEGGLQKKALEQIDRLEQQSKAGK